MPEDLISRPIFENFSDDEIKDLLSVAVVIKYEAGDFIFRQGDEGTDIYIIFTGEVQLTVKNRKNEDVHFPVASNGTILGEISFFDGKTRTATIKAINSLEAIVISNGSLQKLAEINPKVTIKVLMEIGRITAERLRWADNLFIDLIKGHKQL